jgi:hypothetical protein
MGNNEWAAWSQPKGSRKGLITGLPHIKMPLVFTFRACQKTKQSPKSGGKTEIINIGWQPVAPLEIVHALDLTFILPPRADGVPVWKSDQIGEEDVPLSRDWGLPSPRLSSTSISTPRARPCWRRGGVAARGARTAAQDAGDRVP